MTDHQTNAGNSALGNEKRPPDIQKGGSEKPMNEVESPIETGPESKRHIGGPDRAEKDDAARFEDGKGGSVGEQGDAGAPSYADRKVGGGGLRGG